MKFSYLQQSNIEYIDALYQQYLKDNDSVSSEWRLFFEGLELAQRWNGASVAPVPGSESPALAEKELAAYELLRAYREFGHLGANLDPLGLMPTERALFQPERYGLRPEDLDLPVQAGRRLATPQTSLRAMINFLDKTYCGTLAVQVGSCSEEVQNWFYQEMESGSPSFELTPEDRRQILVSLIRTESLEKFLHTRFVGAKRFSIEGGDALLPMLETIVTRGAPLGMKELVIGMAHRGRINVLANFMDKALDVILAEFDGRLIDRSGYEGDVKYHLGYSTDKVTAGGTCHVSLAFNPSHLEAVDPVAAGMTRAKQRQRQDTEKRQAVIPLLIHGDAAFAGQGVVAETLQLSQLPGYTVGGTLHVIINNQIGFTTDPKHSRSTRYSSDMSNIIRAPVILVNADDVEACARAADMALRFRQTFKQDVVIDLICYRRFGHNEADEPSFTQPVMYDRIREHETVRARYQKHLANDGVVTTDWADSHYVEKMENLQTILEKVRQNPPEFKPLAFGGLWQGFRRGQLEDFEKSIDTHFPKEELLRLSHCLTTPPENFHLHPKLERLIGQRGKMITDNQVDWAMGELLAYASLLSEGTSVRLSGQDVMRGTFTHRQAIYFDTQDGRPYSPLAQVNPAAEFVAYNSSLSEMAVLGFEYGNAISDPTFLTIWEAQFGDFANGAQIIIDQFLSSGEEKWARMVGLTLYLPHGYEGQGPEHSSARLERFMQLAGRDSLQICNLTTPANLFHVLRRQMKRDFRKPLVIMTPKSLLRHPQAVSSLDDLARGPFLEVLEDASVMDESKVDTLILCSGKIYYDLEAKRNESRLKNRLAIVRLEQLAPFPKVQLVPCLNGFPQLSRILWVQEEPRNMGAYMTIEPQIEELLTELGLRKLKVEYVGRTERSSPAVGSARVHQREQEEILRKSLQLELKN